MEVYRIVLKKWSKKLYSSGYAARWNSGGNFVIYTAASRALACLESMVHRRGKGFDDEFKLLVIEIPDPIKKEVVSMEKLPARWFEITNHPGCRMIGDEWLAKKNAAVLQVPSAIIPREFNYLLNPSHPEFRKIKLTGVEDFRYDKRVILSRVH